MSSGLRRAFYENADNAPERVEGQPKDTPAGWVAERTADAERPTQGLRHLPPFRFETPIDTIPYLYESVYTVARIGRRNE